MPAAAPAVETAVEAELRRATPHPLWSALVVTGIALCFVALLHTAVEWYPVRVRNIHWRYMTTGATIDGLPLLTVGLFAISCGLVGWRAVRPLKLLAVACVLLAGAVGLVYAGLLSSLTRVFAMAEGSFDEATIRTSVINASFAAYVTIIFYLWLAWTAWTQSAASRSVRT